MAYERFGSIEICEDAFPDDPNEWANNDEDGIGDNADQDDDNDGVSDKVREDAGTDSFSSADEPFAGVTLPVLDVKLQEWDLILKSVLAVRVLCTSHSRSFHAIEELEEFEQLIHEAQTELELRAISDKYERAMQMRLIGTHQVCVLNEFVQSAKYFGIRNGRTAQLRGRKPAKQVVPLSE